MSDGLQLEFTFRLDSGVRVYVRALTLNAAVALANDGVSKPMHDRLRVHRFIQVRLPQPHEEVRHGKLVCWTVLDPGASWDGVSYHPDAYPGYASSGRLAHAGIDPAPLFRRVPPELRKQLEELQ